MTTARKPRPVKVRNQSYVKHYNIQAVLRVLEEHQPVSRTEIVRLTQMSPTSITRIINALINLGLIYETDAVPSSNRGRKAINLCIKPDGMYTFGVFLTYDSICACLMDYGNHVLHTDRLELERRPYSPEELAALSHGLFDAIPRELARDWKYVCGLGVSCAGIVDPEAGRVVRSDQMLWDDQDLRGAFQRKFGLPVWIENDVKACLTGEKARRGLADSVDTAYLMVGTGVGVAATVSGRVMRGDKCRAGEIERVPLVSDAPEATSLHQHIIEASLLERAARFDPTVTSISALVFNMEKPWAREILDDFKRYLVFIIRMIDGVCDPRYIILGGTLIPALAPLLRDALPAEQVIIGEDYEQACVTGAAIVAMRGAIHALINEQIAI